MYIDENRPNIKVIYNGNRDPGHFNYRDYNGTEFATSQMQGKSIPSPIVIANPLPPFFMGQGEQVPNQTATHLQTSVTQPGYPTPEASSQPTKPPPSFTPTHKKVAPFNGDGGSLMPCLYHFAYVWSREQNLGYWFYLTDINKDNIVGYMWTGYRYIYKMIETNKIDTYQCY